MSSTIWTQEGFSTLSVFLPGQWYWSSPSLLTLLFFDFSNFLSPDLSPFGLRTCHTADYQAVIRTLIVSACSETFSTQMYLQTAQCNAAAMHTSPGYSFDHWSGALHFWCWLRKRIFCKRRRKWEEVRKSLCVQGGFKKFRKYLLIFLPSARILHSNHIHGSGF